MVSRKTKRRTRTYRGGGFLSKLFPWASNSDDKPKSSLPKGPAPEPPLDPTDKNDPRNLSEEQINDAIRKSNPEPPKEESAVEPTKEKSAVEPTTGGRKRRRTHRIKKRGGDGDSSGEPEPTESTDPTTGGKKRRKTRKKGGSFFGNNYGPPQQQQPSIWTSLFGPSQPQQQGPSWFGNWNNPAPNYSQPQPPPPQRQSYGGPPPQQPYGSQQPYGPPQQPYGWGGKKGGAMTGSCGGSTTGSCGGKRRRTRKIRKTKKGG
jgi:hypothetical protein